jgi:hypothetical protein
VIEVRLMLASIRKGPVEHHAPAAQRHERRLRAAAGGIRRQAHGYPARL